MTSKIYITKKQGSNQDVVDHFFDNFSTGTLTTDHAASSYDQPVILENGELLDYAMVEAITLPYGAPESFLAAARTLEPLGIQVSQESVAPQAVSA